MKNRGHLCSLLTCGAVLAGCAAPLNFQTAEFGNSPSADGMRKLADGYLANNLKDPDSRRVRWIDQEPKQAAFWQGVLRENGGWNYCWAMRFGVNARNSYGGYTGEEVWYVLQTPAMISNQTFVCGPLYGGLADIRFKE